MTEWISVKDRLPIENQSISFKISKYEFPLAGFYREEEFNEGTGNMYIDQTLVTHWIALPTLPNIKL